MKLIIAIVNSDDSEALLDNLSQRGHRATVVSTIGGFLRRGNTTLFIGAEDDKVEQVFYIIRKNCRTRVERVYPPWSEFYVLPPVTEVEVGGATIFVLNVERYEHF